MLIGPNGVGKSTIGRILAKNFSGCFISIEEFFLERYPTLDQYRANKDGAYAQLEAHIRERHIACQQPIIFEEVGLSEHAQRLVHNLAYDFNVLCCKVMANRLLCADRVAQRGLQHSYPKAPGMLKHVYQDFVARSDGLYAFDLEIINESLSEAEICAYFQPYF